MASQSRTTTQEAPFQVVPFVFHPSEGIGPPFIATLNIPRLTIGLPVWLFNLVIPITPNISNVTSPQPNPSPSSSIVASSLYSSSLDQSSMVSSHVDKKKKKGNGKKKKDKKEKK